MSDHMLSQEEVDALLRGGDADTPASLPDLDAVTQLFQKAFDHVAPLAPPIAGKNLEAGSVTAEFVPWGDLRTQLMSPLVAMWKYEGPAEGIQLSIADSSARQQLRVYLAGEDPATVLNKLALALSEGLSQVVGAAYKADIDSYREIDPEKFEEVKWRSDDVCVVLQMSLRGDTGDVSWVEVLPVPLVEAMLAAAGLVESEEEVSASTPAGPSAVAAPAEESAPSVGGAGAVTVTPAEFAPLAPMPNDPEPANIGLIMDVPLHVTVELGRRRMLVKDVLELGKGSLIELDKLAGEPVDVFVNGKLIAKGEVVVIDENFGVKVTSIVTPAERVRNLQ